MDIREVIKEGGYYPRVESFVLSVIDKLEKMRNLEKVDEATITLLAENYQQVFDSIDVIKQEGLCYTSRGGSKYVHPASIILKTAQLIVLKILTDMGLQPRDRLKKLNTDGKKATAFEEFLNEG